MRAEAAIPRTVDQRQSVRLIFGAPLLMLLLVEEGTLNSAETAIGDL